MSVLEDYHFVATKIKIYSNKNIFLFLLSNIKLIVKMIIHGYY